MRKMKVALKEANETLSWLALCEIIGDLEVAPEMSNSLNEIMSILSRIIITSKKNLNLHSNQE